MRVELPVRVPQVRTRRRDAPTHVQRKRGVSANMGRTRFKLNSTVV